MKNITMDQAQDLRKKGYTVVVSHNYNKVLLVTKDEQKAYNLKKEFAKKNKVVKILVKLVKMEISRNDVNRALRELELGLNCRSI